MFVATRYNNRPAVFDRMARVYYFCRSMVRARKWASELNAGK